MASQESAYRIIYHQVARNQAQACVSRLSLAGWEMRALSEKLATMEAALKESPLSYAEALYQLRPLGLIIAIVCARPFAFHIGVHEESRTVFIREAAQMTMDET